MQKRKKDSKYTSAERAQKSIRRLPALQMADGNERHDPLGVDWESEERGIPEQIAEAGLVSVAGDAAGSRSSERPAAERRRGGGAVVWRGSHVGKAGRKRHHHVRALSHLGDGIRRYQPLQLEQSHHQQRHGSRSAELHFRFVRFLYLDRFLGNKWVCNEGEEICYRDSWVCFHLQSVVYIERGNMLSVLKHSILPSNVGPTKSIRHGLT